MFYKHTVFHQMKAAHWKNFDTNIYFCQKCELISYRVIDYKHDVYNRDLFLFNFYTVQSKNLYPNLPVMLFKVKIYTPICLVFFLLVTKCFFLRGSISQYSNELYLCFLAIFFLSLLSILHEHNIKCISYCSLWQFNLLCVILQISSTNDCMALILLTSLISHN